MPLSGVVGGDLLRAEAAHLFAEGIVFRGEEGAGLGMHTRNCNHSPWVVVSPGGPDMLAASDLRAQAGVPARARWPPSVGFFLDRHDLVPTSPGADRRAGLDSHPDRGHHHEGRA